MNDSCSNGPFEIDLKVHITDGETDGVVTYNLPKGTFPSVDTIRGAIEKVRSTVEEMPGKFRLMDRHEFITAVLDLPIAVAVPGPDEFPSP